MKTKLKNIFLIGAGGHAKSCIDVIESTEMFSIKGLFGYENQVGENILGYEIIDKIENLINYSNKNDFFLITIGLVNNGDFRKNIFEKYYKKLKFATIISPRSYIAKNSTIGNGSIIMHDVLINSDVNIGLNCIINSKSLIEHESVIKDHCHLSTNAVINGNVKVGENSFIGSGSIIKNGITLPPYSFVPMGRKVTDEKRIITNYEK